MSTKKKTEKQAVVVESDVKKPKTHFKIYDYDGDKKKGKEVTKPVEPVKEEVTEPTGMKDHVAMIVKEMENIRKSFFTDKTNSKFPSQEMPSVKDIEAIKKKLNFLQKKYKVLLNFKKKGKKSEFTGFSKPIYVEHEFAKFIHDNKPWKENYPSFKGPNKSAILTRNFINNWFTYWSDLNKLKDGENKLIIVPDDKMEALLNTKFPGLFKGDYKETDVEVTKVKSGKYGIKYAQLQKTYSKYIIDIPINNVTPEMTKELTFMSEQLAKFKPVKEKKVVKKNEGTSNGDEVEEEEDVDDVVLSVEEFYTKVLDIVKDWKVIEDRFYPKDWDKKNYPNGTAGKRDFIGINPKIKEIAEHYEHLYKKLIHVKVEGNKSSTGFLNISIMTPEVFNELNLGKLGLPKTYANRGIGTAMMTHYFYRHGLVKPMSKTDDRKVGKNGKKEPNGKYKLNSSLLKLFKDNLEGETEDGKKYKINPDDVKTTDVQRLFKNHFKKTDGKCPTDTLDKIKEIMALSKSVTVLRGRLEKEKSKLDNDTASLDKLKKDYSKDKSHIKSYEEEVSKQTKKVGSIQDDLNKGYEKLGF